MKRQHDSPSLNRNAQTGLGIKQVAKPHAID
jgi:hypothetical protein